MTIADELPVFSIDYNPQTREFYIFTEIPITLKEADAKSRNEALQAFGALILQLEFGLQPSMIEQLTFSSVFTIQAQCANTNCITLGQNGVFFIVGDAALRANPLFGHGVEKAIKDGNVLYFCFAENGSLQTLDPMIARAQQNRREFENLDKSFMLGLIFYRRMEPTITSVTDAAIPTSPTFTPLLEALNTTPLLSPQQCRPQAQPSALP